MRFKTAEPIYRTADTWRDRGLAKDDSILWPGTPVWTASNLKALHRAYIEHPDESSRGFLEKWRDQLANEPPDVHRLAAEVLLLYYAFPDWIKKTTKLNKIREVVSWKLQGDPPNAPALEALVGDGIGGVGTHYQTAVPWITAFFIQFALELKRRGVSPGDRMACQELAGELQSASKHTSEARNTLLHLLFPDYYEPSVSTIHKELITASFGTNGASGDLDERLLHIREQLTQRFGYGFSFYDEEVRAHWDPAAQGSVTALQPTLEEILADYDYSRKNAAYSGDHPVVLALKRATQIIQGLPIVKENNHLRVSYSAGKGNWAAIPWIAVMDDRETSTTRRGLYCVLLFRQDGSGVYLTLNQGVTEPIERYGKAGGQARLRERAQALRASVGKALRDGGFATNDAIALNAAGNLAENYEVSTVAYKLYERQAVPAGDALARDLTAALETYSAALSSAGSHVPTQTIPLSTVASAFSGALDSAGVNFTIDTVRAFLASVLTKPLVILTGLSGSGKTQIALRFGDWLGVEHTEVVVVRPDWTGPDSLFGYEDILRTPSSDGRRSWFVPSALRFLLEASRNPKEPYLLVLDEMNLAHVERYFADFLSGVESRDRVMPNLALDGQEWRLSPDGEYSLPIPRNLFVVGTVNVDETTYMFSPKVLDRANTLEFRVHTEDLSDVLRRPLPVSAAAPEVRETILSVAMDDSWQEANPARGISEFTDGLRAVHGLLSLYGSEFGYRSFYEARRFCSLLSGLGEPSWEAALDYQILQKVLPRIHGSRRKVEPLLASLAYFCSYGKVVSKEEMEHFDARSPLDAQCPRSLDKVVRMLASLRTNQFVSFSE